MILIWQVLENLPDLVLRGACCRYYNSDAEPAQVDGTLSELRETFQDSLFSCELNYQTSRMIRITDYGHMMATSLTICSPNSYPNSE